MAFYKYIARLSHFSFNCLKKLTNFLDAFSSGFWLGIMGEKSLDYSDELYYSSNKSYSNDKYNLSGLFEWEKNMVIKHFPPAKSILLIAAGGGREVIALTDMGYSVEAFECNRSLLEYGNNLLRGKNVNASIEYLARNSVPAEIKLYDVIIIGWGAYSHIRGRKKRLKFLTEILPFLKKESPIMISFLYVTNRTIKDTIVKKISDFLVFFSRKERTEPGDRLEPDYIHYFTEEEIRNELEQSNFRVLEYSATDYGCLIATR
jgi:2-polyprenyl-3-methyl-5-hydroxy-6-metoxy-1,4-benzoquinol methylase